MKKDPFGHREARKYEHPIASREFILASMEKTGEPMSYDRLVDLLDIEEGGQREALLHRLKAMLRDGQLVMDRRNRYVIASKMELVTGKISAHPDGFGFLVTPKGDEDVFLSARQMRRVFHGDVAQVRVGGEDRRGRLQGDIVEVIERHTEQLVGRIFHDGNLCFVEPLNNRINLDILLPQAKVKQQPVGQIVVVRVLEQPTGHGHVTAEIMEVMGDQLRPDMEVEIALRNHDIPIEWPSEVTAAVAAMPDEVREKDLAGREDLRHLPFVTIDGEDAKDFDDAVLVTRRPRGGWQLQVAIADVGQYVDVGSELDKAAYARGTSVYFPQYVVPMLPEKLSNGLCSLRPQVDRLVIVCDISISAAGRITDYKFYEAVIRSAARLTYTQVATLLRSPNGHFEPQAVVPHLLELEQLYTVLMDQRQDRGALEFESTELQFFFDDKGNVASIQPRSRNIAHRIIEECMLCANVCAARFIVKHGKPGLFRVHEPPGEEKVERLKGFLQRFDVTFDAGETPTTQDYQRVIASLQEKKNSHVLQMALLRSMNQAVYQVDNKGHFGLGYKEYAHFTSPIRRYPDLLMHRMIKSVIHSRTLSDWILRFGKTTKANYYPYEKAEVIMMGEQTSMTERRADAAVYEVLDWIKCDYMSDRVGDIHDGVITGVAKFGFFVELADVFVEGLVHVSTLTGDYFQFDTENQTLVGERTRTVYGMGDTVSIEVARVNVAERKLDYELVSHSPLLSRSKGGRQKAKPRAKTAKTQSGASSRRSSATKQAAAKKSAPSAASKAGKTAKSPAAKKPAAKKAAVKKPAPEKQKAAGGAPRRRKAPKDKTAAKSAATETASSTTQTDGDASKPTRRRRRR